jgi:hypothetical protein
MVFLSPMMDEGPKPISRVTTMIPRELFALANSPQRKQWHHRRQS